MSNQYRSALAGAAGTGGDAIVSDVLSGKTFTNDNGPQTGTMTNNGAVSRTISAGQSYTIPAGYHNGSGTVTATSSAPDMISFSAASSNTQTRTATYNATENLSKLYALVTVAQAGGLGSSDAPTAKVNNASVSVTSVNTIKTSGSGAYLISLDNISNGDTVEITFALSSGNGNIDVTFFK